jgi:hypothetical protein
MQVYDFVLYDTMGNPLSPKYINSMGLPCDAAKPNCKIRIRTNFMAECRPALPSPNPVPPLTCTTPAEFVAVIYKIDQNPASLSEGGQVKPVQGGVYTQVEEIAPPGSGVCP